MKQTINRISNRIGDWFATLFTLTALLLVPHAIIRPIIGIGLHHWIPIQWLVLHAMLIILTLCFALAAHIIADRTAPEHTERSHHGRPGDHSDRSGDAEQGGRGHLPELV